MKLIWVGLFALASARPDGLDRPCPPGVHCPRQSRSTCAAMPDFMKNADRIVGGEAAPSMIPWQVAMLSGSFQFCGGTILDSCTILTAAHCGINTGHSIRAGSLSKTSGGQVRGISQVISNTDLPYNSQTTNNDWVIAKLDSPLTLGGDVQAACLPSSASYLSAQSTEARCFTSGWGTLSSGGSSPNDLQYVRVPAITNSQCDAAYGGSITDTMLCAGYPNVGGKDACQGDSGGPFVCDDNGNAVIAGVVSWGIGCAHPNYPGVYARVTSVLSWIQSNMGSCGGSPSPPPSPPSPPSPTPPSDACGFPQWQGDNYCDDENNNAGCNWDGGDCCGDDVNENFCSTCECLDPNDPSNQGVCGSPQWQGDNWCDDDNNNAGCEWDGGDCCGDDVNTQYCSACECLDPAKQCTGTCGAPIWKGDGYCDDNNNNCGCDFDGGDCCGSNVNTQYCSVCECLATKYWGYHPWAAARRNPPADWDVPAPARRNPPADWDVPAPARRNPPADVPVPSF